MLSSPMKVHVIFMLYISYSLHKMFISRGTDKPVQYLPALSIKAQYLFHLEWHCTAGLFSIIVSRKFLTFDFLPLCVMCSWMYTSVFSCFRLWSSSGLCDWVARWFEGITSIGGNEERKSTVFLSYSIRQNQTGLYVWQVCACTFTACLWNENRLIWCKMFV